jgi:hypothetical protein
MSNDSNSNVGCGGAIAAFIILALIMAIYLPIKNHSAHVSCLRLSEGTGMETQYKRSGLNGECYIKVNGRWIPESRWRDTGVRES